MIESFSSIETEIVATDTRSSRLVALYALTILVAVALFFVIRAFGESLLTPPAGSTAISREPSGTAQIDVLMHVLLALLTIIVTCRVIGSIFRSLHQPPVMGEVLAGIILGPSVLGRVSPDVASFLLPQQQIAPFLGLISQLGVILYMFIVGLELDTTALLRRTHAAVAISHASIVVPFLLGSALALFLYPRLSTGAVPFTVFALVLGVAMSVTAFPVLARILTDRGMSQTPVGVMALTCAAIDDVTAWCLLALVVGVAQSKIGGAVTVIVGATVYVALILLAARPLRQRISRFAPDQELTAGTTAFILIGVLLSALITELIGIHAVFGAFVLGALIPHDSAVAGQITRKMHDIVSILLLPAFFGYAGMRTQIGLVTNAQEWLLCGLIVLVATLGKFGGSMAAARLAGIGWRDASALGVLMNTRGLMELIVLNIGLDLNVISPRLFAMMVLMAVVTTMATAPILNLLVFPNSSWETNGRGGQIRNWRVMWATRRRPRASPFS
jgi:Kef-type K+ transport system membrane component KefB